MPANGPVSLTRQTIYCFIPIMNWYAAYNIRKFRRYLLIAIIVELSLGAMYASLIPEYDKSGIKKGAIPEDISDLEIDWTEIILRTDHPSGLPILLLIIISEYSVTVFLIRRWSNQWNNQFN